MPSLRRGYPADPTLPETDGSSEMKKPKKLFDDPSMERCQNELVEYLRVLKYIGITQHGKLNDRLIDKFEKCVDWEAWSEKNGWPTKDVFHSMSNNKKMYIISGSLYPFKKPLPELESLDGV